MANVYINFSGFNLIFYSKFYRINQLTGTNNIETISSNWQFKKIIIRVLH